MKIDDIKYVYLMGIGGIGMSALARYFNFSGKQVSGYDRIKSPLIHSLEKEGIDVHTEDDPKNIPSVLLESKEKSLIIYTPAIPQDHREMGYFRSQGFEVIKRSVVLGMIADQGKCIGVAGTHGKTTTSSMIAFLLKETGTGCNAFIGGIMSNYNSNILLDEKAENYVVEADEFDRSFLALNPDLAIITSIDADHLDIYGGSDHLVDSFKLYSERVSSAGVLLVKKEIQAALNSSSNQKTYSIVDSEAHYYGADIRIKDGKYCFTMVSPQGKIEDLQLGMPGRHNVENATAALACCLEMGVDGLKLKSALSKYLGVKRRFETVYQDSETIYIDDYAHHPEEIKAAIYSAKELFPDKKITGIFQPHLFSRTRDFADAFASSLNLLDEIILLPIYPAREKPIAGVDSQLILDKIQKSTKKLVEKNVLLYEIKENRPEVLLTLGAGDIDQLVNPLKELFSQ